MGLTRTRSYVNKHKKRPDRSKFKSKKKSKSNKKIINISSINHCIYDTSMFIDDNVLLNKQNNDSSYTKHPYEDRTSKYIDPNGKFVMIGLFDGHSGSYSSKVLASVHGLLQYIANKINLGEKINSKLFDKSFSEFDNKYLSKTESGATTTVIYLSKDEIYVANVGDSPAYSIMNTKGTNNIHQLSVEHDYFNLKERKRVFDASKSSSVWEDERVHGTIQAARGMGDFEIKEEEMGVFINNPSILKIPKNKLNDFKHLKYLMITSDGVTDPFTEKYESQNLNKDGDISISDKIMLKNSLKNFNMCIYKQSKQNKIILKNPPSIIKSIINLVIKKVDNDYQDDISIILIDVQKILSKFI